RKTTHAACIFDCAALAVDNGRDDPPHRPFARPCTAAHVVMKPPIPFACAGTNGPPADGARRAALGALARWAGAVVLLGPPLLAHGASIVAVRVWPAPDYTRVTLESDTSLLARHFLLSGPDRLVVDIEGLELNPTLR